MDVLIVGAGTMGHSLAQVFAMAGHQVHLTDKDQKCMETALRFIRSNLNTLREGGIDPGEDAEVLSRIHTSPRIEEAAEGVALAIEAVYEDVKIKKEVFTLLDRHCPADAILASNTSYLNIFEIADTARPDKVIIAHWYAPPHIIPLVEVVKGPGTSWDTVRRVEVWLKEMGKHPVILREFVPGFIVNRIQRAITREVLAMLSRGIFSHEEIDEAVRWSLGIRLPVLGVVRRLDYAGLDLVRKYLGNPSIQLADSDDDARALIEKMVGEDRLGIKNSRGFYDYRDCSTEDLMKKRDLELLKWLRVMEKQE